METGRLSALGADLLVALEEFLAGKHGRFDLDSAWRDVLDTPMPAEGLGADAVLRLLREQVVPYGSPMSDPGFQGFITAPGGTVATLASLAQSVVANQRYFAHSGNLLEGLSLRWLADLLGLPEHGQGVISSDGSAATTVALGAARQQAYERLGIDVAAAGLSGPRPVVYASQEAHHCVLKAAAIVGIGRANVRLVATDDKLRMSVSALGELMAADAAAGHLAVAVVSTVGTTMTGSVDPVDPVADLCEQHGAWLHVDGAYGIAASLDPRVAPLFAGIPRADSVLVDGHKWFGTPIGAGVLLVRDVGPLARAFTAEASGYLEDPVLTDTSRYGDLGIRYDEFGLELSAPARGVMLWAALAELGRDGVAEMVSRDLDRARRLAALAAEHPELELMLEPDLSVVCFRYVGGGGDLDALNAAILERLRSEDAFAPSVARVRGAFCLRPVYLNPRTRDEDVQGLVDEVLRVGRLLTG